jgi:hypothetical protein
MPVLRWPSFDVTGRRALVRRSLMWLSLVGWLWLALPGSLFAQIPDPEAHFGFRMGADRRLAPAEAVERYFELVASLSDRVEITDLGKSTDGHRTPAAIISAPANISRLEEIRAANQRLADPRTLDREEARKIAASQKAVLAIGAGIHASEVGPTLAANELLHILATSTDRRLLDVLDNVVVILVPMLNPDGHRLVADWYQRYTGTPYEGGPTPWLYHKYAGHDINRDAFMMNLAETRNLSRFFYGRWHPQVFLTMHQMATDGPRFFVPPNADPIDPNYDPLIWRTAALLGSAMGLELQRDGRKGVLSNGMYDYYWPGYEDSAPLGHNTVCLLTEVASVKVASPIAVDPGQLKGDAKALSDHRPQVNFPDPWPGGRWTLRDIVDYDLSAVKGLLFAVSAYREQIVGNFYEMGRRAVEAGRNGGPFAFIIPADQHDPHATARLEELLIDGHIEIYRALEPFRADGEPYPEGTDVILLSQPFRAYVKTLFERQHYPVQRSAATGPPERPYDAAGWTLPLQMGVEVKTIERYFEAPAMSRLTSGTVRPAAVWGERKPGFYLVEAKGNGGAIAVNRLLRSGAAVSWLASPLAAGGYTYGAGSLVTPYSTATATIVADIARDLGLRVDGVRGRPPATVKAIATKRVALYKPWTENIDEGWTRWLLERYEFQFTSITDAEIRAGQLRDRYDTIILPSARSDRLILGRSADLAPPEYVGGLGTDGVEALKRFVEAGGTLICLDESGELAIHAFSLPVRDVAREAADGFFCPGSILRIELETTSPLAYGLRAETAGFFAFSAAYDPLGPRPASDGHGGSSPGASLETVARYASKDLLLSGWIEGEKVIAGRAAVVQATVGAGRIVLLGFRVQHRAQSHASFRLLFNALLDAR